MYIHVHTPNLDYEENESTKLKETRGPSTGEETRDPKKQGNLLLILLLGAKPHLQSVRPQRQHSCSWLSPTYLLTELDCTGCKQKEVLLFLLLSLQTVFLDSFSPPAWKAEKVP